MQMTKPGYDNMLKKANRGDCGEYGDYKGGAGTFLRSLKHYMLKGN
jgi:hypothetical protein